MQNDQFFTKLIRVVACSVHAQKKNLHLNGILFSFIKKLRLRLVYSTCSEKVIWFLEINMSCIG